MSKKTFSGEEPTESKVAVAVTGQTFLQAARRWHEFGLSVIPVLPGEKKTALKWDPWLEELSPEAITAHWGRHPEHELGFIVGAVLVVFDADAPEAVASMNQLMASFDITCNHVVSTSKGEHYYFRLAPGTMVTADAHDTQCHPERLDIKHGRSMVVLPPSTGKSISLLEAETTDDLVEVGQDFIDAVYRHNGRNAPTLSVPGESAAPKTRAPGGRAEEIEKLLGVIDPDIGYNDWLAVGMAIFHEFQGNDDGLALWHDWSSRGKKYKGYVPIRVKWDSFEGHRGDPVTIATIYKLAKDAGANFEAIFEEFFEPLEDIHGVADIVAKLQSGDFTDDTEAEEEHDLAKFSLRGRRAEFEAEMQQQVLILGKIAIRGQWTVIYAPPNTGKTLLVLHELIQGIKIGNFDPEQLFYINADDSHYGLTQKLRLVEQHGFHMLAPGYQGFRAKDFLKILKGLCDNGQARKTVVVLDTLKKFTDLMDKRMASDFGNAVREFIGKGGTVIALAHVNKNRNPEGKPVPAGTSDIVDDADCAYVMDTISDDNDIRIVEFENIKNRGMVAKRAAYQYSTLESQDYMDLLASVVAVDDTKADALRKAAEQFDEREPPIIEAISDCIANGTNSKTKLVEAAAAITGDSRRQVQRVLEQYSGTEPEHLWTFTIGAHGVNTYELLTPDDAPSIDELLDEEDR